MLTERASADGIYTLIETHPNTYADRLDAVVRLLDEVNHPHLGINLDFLHLWESGTSPLEAWAALKPAARHIHLKNILNPNMLHVFSPDNVYSPSGERSFMVPLASGAVDYSDILGLLAAEQKQRDASLEWFGNKPFQYLVKEMAWLRKNRFIAGNVSRTGNADLGYVLT